MTRLAFYLVIEQDNRRIRQIVHNSFGVGQHRRADSSQRMCGMFDKARLTGSEFVAGRVIRLQRMAEQAFF